MAFLQKILLFMMITAFLFPSACPDANSPIPSDKSKLTTWFNANVGALHLRKSSLYPILLKAEASSTIVRAHPDGLGDFRTLTDAIKSIPDGNTNRVIIMIAPGNYVEKVIIEKSKKFITLVGDLMYRPTLVYNGTAAQYGTWQSATLIVESDYFVCVNLNIKNSAPRPNHQKDGAQAVALRVSRDKVALYNCNLYGFQDTLCDDKGVHFFKDCYIEGTVDFIFGNGKSIYLNTEMHVIFGDNVAYVTAQGRNDSQNETEYSFVHCAVTGMGQFAYLGRAWRSYAKVIFSYSYLSDVVNPMGWSDNDDSFNDGTLYFREYNNNGPGSSFNMRAIFGKRLSDAEVNQFIVLAYVRGSTWLLPPPTPIIN